MFRTCLFITFAAVLSAADVPPTLDDVRKEANLEKRSGIALEYADYTLDAARKAWHAEDDKLYRAALTSVGEAVNLSYKSLQETGKAARRNPKYFKRAELKLRQMIRRLDALENEVDFESRAAVIETRKIVQAIHDQLLADIMTKK